MEDNFNQGNSFNAPRESNSPQFTLMLILSLVYLVFSFCCCCWGLHLIFALPALICVLVGNSKYKDGDLRGSNKLFTAAKILLIVGVIFSIISGVISFVAGFAGGILDSLFSY